ncbi:fasciclin-3 isoform X1 [Zootermopsis nevadensis]|uniref:fasciclin-3 isoform X1 n=1 Tax=Zootermopsis nevadensis TaxID=136037 RepID=UPI000B8E8BF9|nr:fasciclin-3 isoform X1 [Zootermopsis nevadensis]
MDSSCREMFIWIASTAVAFALLQEHGANAIHVDVSPRNPTVKVGQNFTFMCLVAKPLMYCRIQMPGVSGGLNLNENSERNTEYWYAGDSITRGQCGITINRMTDKYNGQFKCSLGFSGESNESEGTTNVTVARPPQNPPDLMVTPEFDRHFNAYSEDTSINAMCTVRDARPAADLSWFMGDDQITDGLSRLEIVESPTNLFTVHQNLTRKLTWKDNAKDLKCVATHIALDRVLSTIKQINVRFAPRPIPGTIEQFGFKVGDEGIISVQIQAYPKPRLTWYVDQESFPEGRMDSSQRFEAISARAMGNGTWEGQLLIMRVSADDVTRQYVLKATNDVGEQTYRVSISTSTEPEGSLELGTGPIIGIVVAVLVLLIALFMLGFARTTGRWCFADGVTRHDNKESETFIKDSQTQGSNPNKGDNPPDEQKSLTATVKVNESSDTESADHGPAEKSKKPRMNLTYILNKKKDKVAADVEDLKLQNVAMETEKEMENPGTESSEHIAMGAKGKPHGQDVVYAELDLQSTRRPIVRREDDKTEYAEIIHTKPEEGEGGDQ